MHLLALVGREVLLVARIDLDHLIPILAAILDCPNVGRKRISTALCGFVDH